MKWIDKRERMPQKDDEDSMGRVLVYNVYGGVMVCGREDMAQYGGKYTTHWMRIPPITDAGWIAKAQRAPRAEDEDGTGCILAYNTYGGAHVSSAGNFMAYGGQHETHWRRMPDKPRMEPGYLREVQARI